MQEVGYGYVGGIYYDYRCTLFLKHRNIVCMKSEPRAWARDFACVRIRLRVQRVVCCRVTCAVTPVESLCYHGSVRTEPVRDAKGREIQAYVLLCGQYVAMPSTMLVPKEDVQFGGRELARSHLTHVDRRMPLRTCVPLPAASHICLIMGSLCHSSCTVLW